MPYTLSEKETVRTPKLPESQKEKIHTVTLLGNLCLCMDWIYFVDILYMYVYIYI
jgi:hypothetical protein